MNKTQNYQLNQWAKSDRVLMEDFNADNAKIDAAIKANANAISAETSARISAVQAARDACPLVLLRSVTLSSSTDRYDLPLTGFDWNLYGEIYIYMSLKPSNSATNLQVLLDNVSEMGKYTTEGGNSAENFAAFRVESYGASAVCRIPRSARGFHAEWWGSPFRLFHHFTQIDTINAPRSSFQTMNFLGGLAAGSKFTILGIRG